MTTGILKARARRLAFGLAALALAAPAAAQTTPAQGAPERQAIMDALRSAAADKDRVFVVRWLKSDGVFAFVTVDPQSRNGKARYERESALLRKADGRWRVVDQPCGEADCETVKELARIRKAHPAAAPAIFPR